MTTLPEVTFPDAELLLRAFLTANTDARVVTDLPATLEAQLPVVQVTRIGGSVDTRFILDRPVLDIDVYAASREAAATLAREIQALIYSMPNQTVGGGVVADVSEVSGPSWRPDWNAKVRRFGMTYDIAVRPAW